MWLCHWVVNYLSFDFTLVTAQQVWRDAVFFSKKILARLILLTTFQMFTNSLFCFWLLLHFLLSFGFAFKDWCLPKMGGISAACYRNPRVGDPHCLTDGWSQKSLVLYCSLSSSHYYHRSLQAAEDKRQNIERAEEKHVKVVPERKKTSQELRKLPVTSYVETHV